MRTINKKDGKPARFDGRLLTDPNCCCEPGEPPPPPVECCCPPPADFWASLSASEFAQDIFFQLTEETPGSGNCRRAVGSVDLYPHDPTCGLLEVEIDWEDNCTGLEGVTFRFRHAGGTWVEVSLESSSTCTPFCLEGFIDLPCAQGAKLDAGCRVPPPVECCCDPPPGGLFASITCNNPPWDQNVVFELLDVAPEAGECRRMEGSVDLSGVNPDCSTFWLRVTWDDGCDSITGVHTTYRFNSDPWRGILQSITSTCEPLCIEGTTFGGVDPLCCDSIELMIGCGIVPEGGTVAGLTYTDVKALPAGVRKWLNGSDQK